MVTSLITTLIIVVSLYFIKKASKKKSKVDENGNSIHRLPLLYGIGGIIPLIISTIIIVATISDRDTSNLTNAFVLIFLFSSLGLTMCLMVWMNRITMNTEKIVQRNMWGKTTVIELDQIKSISFDKVFLYLYITDDKSKIKCHEHLVGFDEIISQLSKSTSLTRAEMGLIK